MLSEDAGEKSKKKRGRPKGTKNKPKTSTNEPQSKIILGKTLETKEKSTPSESGLSISEAAAIAEAEAKAAAARSEAARLAIEAEAQKQYEAAKKAAEEAVAIETGASFTNKRGQEVIFRREMGEPEFFRYKKDLKPPRPVLSQEEEQEISRKVLQPTDLTPKYTPEHILSPEFSGTSNYERGIDSFKHELEEKLQNLKSSPVSNETQIEKAKEELQALDYLYENYYSGMNVFRTAKRGRKTAKK
jgi:colicin import membrane protein